MNSSLLCFHPKDEASGVNVAGTLTPGRNGEGVGLQAAPHRAAALGALGRPC